MRIEPIKSPMPYFGGKSRIASAIWKRFGDVPNYVDPFCGSLAVPLSRPHPPQTETVNDLDKFISNFFRAVKHDPDAVAWWADQPVDEASMEAQHYWLITKGAETLKPLMLDPDAYDAKIAGWWVHGACSWIGSGWCSGAGPWQVKNGAWVLRNAGKGRWGWDGTIGVHMKRF
jgi:DNA adenine methylase